MLLKWLALTLKMTPMHAILRDIFRFKISTPKGWSQYRDPSLNPVNEYIEKEFQASGLSTKSQENKKKVSDLKRLLRSDENKCFEKEVVIALASFNVVIPADDPLTNLETKLVLLRPKIDNSDNSDIEWADFDVDVEKYFEK